MTIQCIVLLDCVILLQFCDSSNYTSKGLSGHVGECAYTYVRACMIVTVCVYIFACLHAHACICVVARVGMCAHVRTYVFVCVRACVHACTSVCICACKRGTPLFLEYFFCVDYK